jgi:hypothetical protein
MACDKTQVDRVGVGPALSPCKYEKLGCKARAPLLVTNVVGESDQIDKWCSVVTTGTKPTLTKEQPITDRYTDRIRTR